MASLASLIQSLMESFDGGETYVEVYGWFCVGLRDHRIAGCAGKRATFGSWLLENGRTGNDQMFSYRFAADGSYTFHGYMESTMFGCTTSLFQEVTGRYLVDAGTIFLKPSRDVWTNSYSCFPNRNSSQEKSTPAEKSLQFSFKTDEYGKSFICLNDAGVETCYRLEEE